MTIPVLDAHARAGYEAFSAVRRGYRKLPPWDLALDIDKEAWRAVVRAVAHTLEAEEQAKIIPISRRMAPCLEGVRDCNCSQHSAAVR